ncbi:MAG: hypothetical protein M1831_000339 [Alyxoria varia]|nr:MAG: hypothetical protein M1831_000339 [Alyxoria varia]
MTTTSKHAHPPGGTFFDTLKRSFVTVDVNTANQEINTKHFVEAAESLTTLFDVLGSVAFTPVKNDILGNVRKIHDREVAAPSESKTLQALVTNEIKSKKHTAAEGLVWLVRGLDFTAQSLRQSLGDPKQELSDSFRAAYGNTLKMHHNFMVKPIFSAALSATPYRKDFYAKLGSDEAKVNDDLEKWLSALEKQVSILKQFQNTKEAKW